MTPRQLQILRWLHDNPSSRARWLVNGKEPKNEHPDKWTHMEVAGENGSILIASEDNKALHDYIVGCPSHDKLYGPSERGLAALAHGGGNADQA